ncbi:MAG: YHS domain-containing protein [Desulfuromonadales bacterium]|nr:YHS domain-containing protein [Desulfuromonadales bacterium]
MTDPVCGMEVSPENSAGSRMHNGRTYYFCSAKCLEKFSADPDRWLQPAERATEKTKGCSRPNHRPSGARLRLHRR